MSYDITIEGSDESFSITSNVGQIWRDFMPSSLNPEEAPAWINQGIKSLHGKTGAEAFEIIHQFWINLNRFYYGTFRGNVTCLDVDRAIQVKYDPKNGWGSFISCLIFTGRLMAECHKYPDGIVSVLS